MNKAFRCLRNAVCALAVITAGTVFFSPISRAADSPKETLTITDNDEGDRLDVTVKGGYIYITTSRNVTIQLYSILGQLVTQQVIPAGTTRIKAPSRGVFILKAGPITRRVTVNN